jgi:hypothetical protein
MKFIVFEYINELTLADGILGRLLKKAHRIEIKGGSMIKKYKKNNCNNYIYKPFFKYHSSSPLSFNNTFMSLMNLEVINTNEKIDEIIKSIIDGKIQFYDESELKISISLKIRKLKIQLYFHKLFEDNLVQISIQKHNKPIKSVKHHNHHNIQPSDKKKEKNISSFTKSKINSRPNGSVKDKKPKKNDATLQNKNQLSFEMVKDKSIEEISKFVNQSTSRLISLIQKKTNNLNILSSNSIVDETIWNIAYHFLQNSYNLKIRHEKSLTNMSENANKKASKFKPSMGKPGNYSKLIYIKTKT